MTSSAFIGTGTASADPKPGSEYRCSALAVSQWLLPGMTHRHDFSSKPK
ncbi:hypothetical protein [Paenibacillus sp. 32352]|nr:hypothetical protein [Paenibacillus sp. 32352]